MNDMLKRVTLDTELCIVGGGLSGLCAAIAAARRGTKVVLIQDRPVLGGNASSEIGMWVRGAYGYGNRETGVISELEENNIYENPTCSPRMFDSVMYEMVKAEKNITLLLNCSVFDMKCEDSTIKSVTGWQMTTYTFFTVNAKLFADCSGDSILGALSGAEMRHGREARSEYGEEFGPDTADSLTMGNSVLIQARETDHPVPFVARPWAYKYETDESFRNVASHITNDFRQDNSYRESKKDEKVGRNHSVGTSGGNLWWMEFGGEQDCLHDNEEIRDELLKIAFGVWDHIKNYGDHGAENWEIEWIGFLPGKRETNRLMGEYVLTANDLAEGGHFTDIVAYGGWPMDDHDSKGFYADGKTGVASIMHGAASPYGIPYRCLYSRNIKNLFFAGRNISATHAAMSSTRVMATCAVIGQGMGTAASFCARNGLAPAELGPHIAQVQQELIEDGAFLPWNRREVPELTRKAAINLSEKDLDTLFNGLERPRSKDDCNEIYLPLGGNITFTLPEAEKVSQLRLVFDLDYSRKTVTPNPKLGVFAQRIFRGSDFMGVKVAATLVKDFDVYADGKKVYECRNNIHSLVKVPLDVTAKEIKIVFTATNGAEDVRVFACDIQ